MSRWIRVLSVGLAATLSTTFDPPFLLARLMTTLDHLSRGRIAWMPEDRPGSWMYHCHILEHHATGMMAHFEVVR